MIKEKVEIKVFLMEYIREKQGLKTTCVISGSEFHASDMLQIF